MLTYLYELIYSSNQPYKVSIITVSNLQETTLRRSLNTQT